MRIYDSLIEKRFVPVYCDAIIAEYDKVLHRDKFGFNPALVEMVIRHIKDCGVDIIPVETDETFPDADDRVFYCTALAAQDCGAVLVTGNKRHFPNSDFVLTPTEFVARYAQLM